MVIISGALEVPFDRGEPPALDTNLVFDAQGAYDAAVCTGLTEFAAFNSCGQSYASQVDEPVQLEPTTMD